MKKKYFYLLAFIVLVFCAGTNVFADARSYVWTYEYKTVEKGKAELESYFTLTSSDEEKMKGNTKVEQQVELEVGMTEKFDFAIYQVFSQGSKATDTFKYDKFKLRSRYKFGEKGKYFFDPLLYVEYQNKQDFSKDKIELKTILAKDIGKLNIAVNPIFEWSKDGEKWEYEQGYAVGASYEINSLTRVGIEAKGNESGGSIGPVISHGKPDLWFTLGSAFGTGKQKEELGIRMLWGIGF